MTQHATGAIVDTATQLAVAETHLARWRNGELTDDEAAALLERVAAHLRKRCRCNTGCCTTHSTHANPHTGCILR